MALTRALRRRLISTPPVQFTSRMPSSSQTERYHPSPKPFELPSKTHRDVIIVGGGHNGLIAANYLAKAGMDVLVLERRDIIGGAAVTEELYPNFHYSRGSYLAGLLRHSVIEELNLMDEGLEFLPRNPSSFTPTTLDDPLYKGKYLMFWDEAHKTAESVGQFSERDALNMPLYDDFLSQIREILQPILDGPPPQLDSVGRSWYKIYGPQMRQLVSIGMKNRQVMLPFYELLTAPATKILDSWFESQILKTTLATDAVIGSMSPPSEAGSAYVLLHHVMGEIAGKAGVWAYVKGGMGSVTQILSRIAVKNGVEIVTNAEVDEILTHHTGSLSARGVQMKDGTKIFAPCILSNATPYHTFTELIKEPESKLPKDFVRHISKFDYSSGVMKINCAVNGLPNFDCLPSDGNKIGPQHTGTIHFESRMETLETAARQAREGRPADIPIIEMTIPSSLDNSISPRDEGQHVVQLFIQYVPYDLSDPDASWDGVKGEDLKNRVADSIFKRIDEFAPNFSSTVLHRDILSPRDLEKIFGLHRGNIFHGAISLHQLAYMRPAPGFSNYTSPVKGLYVCGSGAHPGGGVMGAPGRNCAKMVLSQAKLL